MPISMVAPRRQPGGGRRHSETIPALFTDGMAVCARAPEESTEK